MVEIQALIAMSVPSIEPAMSSSVRSALLGLIALLVLILACLVVCVILLRRRARASERQLGNQRDAASTQPSARDESVSQETDEWPALGSAEYVVEDPMACPSCRREFESGLLFCPYDASRLVPAADMLEYVPEQAAEYPSTEAKTRKLCPTCRRVFDGSTVYCPHDGSDLVAMATTLSCDHDHRRKGRDEAKICPRCRVRYDYAASFCGKDGVELVVLN